MLVDTAVPARSRLKVVVIDDDPLLVEILCIQLEMLGCDVSGVADGEQGLALLGSNSVDMLVTDWQMPGIDGMEVVSRARATRERDHYLHIVMMTARGDSTTMRAALEAGVDDFLEKPIEEIQLEIAVESARRNRVLHRRLERRNSLLQSAHQRTREALDRVRADLVAATALHERLLPEQGLHGQLAVASLYRPAAVLGGDSIGVSRLPGGRILFFVIDVRGHGVPAALESFHLHHRLKQLRPDTPEGLGAALGVLNAEMVERGDEGYATIACGLLDPAWEEGWIACAGHPAPILCGPDGPTPLDLGRSMPVGWFAGTGFAPGRFEFPRGSRLFVYSDGVTECADARGHELGEAQLSALLHAGQTDSLDSTVETVENALLSRRPRAELEDDMSLLAIEHVQGGTI